VVNQAWNTLRCSLLTVFSPQVEMVFWLLSMLANRDKEEMSRTLLALSSSQDSCIAMRKSGCVPLLVQILHEAPPGGGGSGDTVTGGGASTGCSREAKSRASAALHNVIYSQQDEGQARREMRVLHMLEQVRTYCDSGWDWIESHAMTPSPGGTKTTGEQHEQPSTIRETSHACTSTVYRRDKDKRDPQHLKWSLIQVHVWCPRSWSATQRPGGLVQMTEFM